MAKFLSPISKLTLKFRCSAYVALLLPRCLAVSGCEGGERGLNTCECFTKLRMHAFPEAKSIPLPLVPCCCGWTPVGFVATIPQFETQFVHKTSRSGSRRAHRTVVLPTWQGLGLGSRLSDAVAHINLQQGRSYFGQTVHPRFGKYRDNSALWEATRWNHDLQRYRQGSWKQRKQGIRILLRQPKFIYSHQYLGPHTPSQETFLRTRIVEHF